MYSTVVNGRIKQGDVLKNVKFNTIDSVTAEVFEVLYPYCIVVSQDCDLEQYQKSLDKEPNDILNNQYLPNLILLPAFPEALLRMGKHLKELFLIEQEVISNKQYEKIKHYHIARYHYLMQAVQLQVPELIVDFKLHFTLTFSTVKAKYSDWYLASINPIFREHLSQRFTNYINRIGLPEPAIVQPNGEVPKAVDNLSTTEK